MPNSNDYAQWKEITRLVAQKNGMVELIPNDQTTSNWTELIAIQYVGIDFKNVKLVDEIDFFVDILRKNTLSTYPKDKVSWKLIEKKNNTFIYEWVLNSPWKDIPPQHEIARGFLTEEGFHRIGYTRQHKEMTKEERDYWIKLLKESSSLIPFEEPSKIQGFSLAPNFS